MVYVTAEPSAHWNAHLHATSPPQLADFVAEQLVVLLKPNQHLPALPQRVSAKLESAAVSSLASEPPGAREAQAAEASGKALRLDWYIK